LADVKFKNVSDLLFQCGVVVHLRDEIAFDVFKKFFDSCVFVAVIAVVECAEAVFLVVMDVVEDMGRLEEAHVEVNCGQLRLLEQLLLLVFLEVGAVVV